MIRTIFLFPTVIFLSRYVGLRQYSVYTDYFPLSNEMYFDTQFDTSFTSFATSVNKGNTYLVMVCDFPLFLPGL